MPTKDEINAGFDVADAKIHNWISQLIPDHTIPFVGNLRSIALDKINSQQGRQFLLEEVRGILQAAEAQRNKGAQS